MFLELCSISVLKLSSQCPVILTLHGGDCAFHFYPVRLETVSLNSIEEPVSTFLIHGVATILHDIVDNLY